MVAVLLLIIVVTRVQAHRAKNKPVDMAAVQDEIRRSLGMESSLTIGPTEVGLTMKFSKSLEMELQGIGHTPAGESLANDISTALLAELRRQAGLPSRLADMLKQSGTTVTVDPDAATALVLMQRPINGRLKPGAEERFATVLQQRASSHKISINKHHFVDEVSVAVPRRVPKEMDRSSILRLQQLGEGFYGVVSQACFLNLVACCCARTCGCGWGGKGSRASPCVAGCL